MVNIARRLVLPANEALVSTVRVVICTTRGDHLLASIQPYSNLFSHRPVDSEPMMLGFACHRELRVNTGNYDYYCYLEDDLIIHDPWYFQKLEWFSRQFGNEYLLQPNRYELGPRGRTHKLYIDGDLAPSVTAPFIKPSRQTDLEALALGTRIEFCRAVNPHAGCFFLNLAQMRSWAQDPRFCDGDTSFVGPLESAATLGILRSFHVFKPSRQNASFLEVHHFGTRYLSFVDRLPRLPPTSESASAGI